MPLEWSTTAKEGTGGGINTPEGYSIIENLDPRMPDITGGVFGKLTALFPVRRLKDNKAFWICECECGGFEIQQAGHLRIGNITTCGCIKKKPRKPRPDLSERNKLGRLPNRHAPEYSSWRAMKYRCLNPDSKDFPSYGGRGIDVCLRWLDYDNFLEDMGTRPPGTTIDRINNDGNYEPGNCRWATPKIQATNRRRNNGT